MRRPDGKAIITHEFSARKQSFRLVGFSGFPFLSDKSVSARSRLPTNRSCRIGRPYAHQPAGLRPQANLVLLGIREKPTPSVGYKAVEKNPHPDYDLVSANKVKTRSILICALLINSGCGESAPPVIDEVKVSPTVRLEGLIEESGEVTFYGWNGMEHNGGAHFRLTFQKDRRVKLDTLGYNFVFAHGSYRFEGDSLIDITFEQIDAPESDKVGYTTDWPSLRLTESEGRLLIHREDGGAAWHIDWPLYPEITGNLWPVSTSTRNAEDVDPNA
ncbi:MAG: hypothetical protein WBE58_02200 [Verrucomicrobiales bacterium]